MLFHIGEAFRRKKAAEICSTQAIFKLPPAAEICSTQTKFKLPPKSYRNHNKAENRKQIKSLSN